MAICQLHSMQLQKEVKSNPKQPSCKKGTAPKKTVVKKFKIQGGGKANGKNFNNSNLAC